MSRVGWVLAHLADLRTDFKRFFPQYGRDPIAEMDGPELFEMAERVGAYGGVMAVRVQQAQADAPHPTHGAAGVPGDGGDQVVDLAAFRAMFPGAVSTRKVARGG